MYFYSGNCVNVNYLHLGLLLFIYFVPALFFLTNRFQVRPRFGGGVVSFIKRVLPWMKELASTEWPHVLFLTPTDGSLLL